MSWRVGAGLAWAAVASCFWRLAGDAGAAEPERALRYAWRENQVIGYRVEITAERDDVTETLHGVIIYTGLAPDGELLRLAYHGGLTRSVKAKPARRPSGPPFGFPRPPIPRPPGFLFSRLSFGGLRPARSELTLTDRGEIRQLKTETQLPYLLGHLAILPFEPLPVEPQSQWSVENPITISEHEAGDAWPPFRFRPPLAASDRETSRRSGSEGSDYAIEKIQGDLVVVRKTYRLESPEIEDRSFRMSGDGRWTFHRGLGAPESSDMHYQLTVRDGNVTVTIPLTVRFARLTGEELAKHQQEQRRRREEAQRRLAELQRQQAEKPLGEQERLQLLENLRSVNVARVLSGLQQVQRKSPKTLDREIRQAVAALRGHENPLVRRMAEQAAQKWAENSSP